tara:strand:+ start:1593 stop:3095 length:1503 start_codon:yes stop_codon:yes gene_type:complete
MNDGSSLTGTHTFTNGSAIVQANASGAYKSEVKIGDVLTTAGGEKVRVKNLTPPRTVATSSVNASNERITITAHGYTANTPLTYSAEGGTAIAGLTDGQIVFVKTVHDANTIDVSATEGGSVINLTGTGNNSQTFVGETNTGITLTSNFGGSTESGVAATVSRPPIDGHGGAIDANVLGIDEGESVAGVDNVTDIGVSEDGARYVQAPTITVAGPTARTLATGNVSLANDTFTLTNHNMRTGTKLTYDSQGGTNLAQNSGNIADSTALFVIRVDADTIKLASNLTNAEAGTAIDFTGGSSNVGNSSQTLTGDTATATATISGGVVTGITVTDVGSDYQSTPTVTVEVPKMTIPTGNVNASSNVITFTAHGLSDGDQITYNQVGGGTLMTNVTNGQTVFVRDKTANTFKIAATEGGTAINIGTGHSAQTFTIVTGATQSTAVASLGLGNDGDTNTTEISHVGWVKKTVGSGGRAGRVHYETLVAASSISGDAADDIALPDS